MCLSHFVPKRYLRFSTCKFTVTLKPETDTYSAFTCWTLQIPGTAGGGVVYFRSLPGRSKMLFKDLARFSCKLFVLNFASMCSTSAVQVLALLAGIIRQVSSAYDIRFREFSGCRSEAVTT